MVPAGGREMGREFSLPDRSKVREERQALMISQRNLGVAKLTFLLCLSRARAATKSDLFR